MYSIISEIFQKNTPLLGRARGHQVLQRIGRRAWQGLRALGADHPPSARAQPQGEERGAAARYRQRPRGSHAAQLRLRARSIHWNFIFE